MLNTYTRLKEVLVQGISNLDTYSESFNNLTNILKEKDKKGRPNRQVQSLLSANQSLLLTLRIIRDIKSKKLDLLEGSSNILKGKLGLDKLLNLKLRLNNNNGPDKVIILKVNLKNYNLRKKNSIKLKVILNSYPDVRVIYIKVKFKDPRREDQKNSPRKQTGRVVAR